MAGLGQAAGQEGGHGPDDHGFVAGREWPAARPGTSTTWKATFPSPVPAPRLVPRSSPAQPPRRPRHPRHPRQPGRPGSPRICTPASRTIPRGCDLALGPVARRWVPTVRRCCPAPDREGLLDTLAAAPHARADNLLDGPPSRCRGGRRPGSARVFPMLSRRCAGWCRTLAVTISAPCAPWCPVPRAPPLARATAAALPTGRGGWEGRWQPRARPVA